MVTTVECPDCSRTVLTPFMYHTTGTCPHCGCDYENNYDDDVVRVYP